MLVEFTKGEKEMSSVFFTQAAVDFLRNIFIVFLCWGRKTIKTQKDYYDPDDWEPPQTYFYCQNAMDSATSVIIRVSLTPPGTAERSQSALYWINVWNIITRLLCLCCIVFFKMTHWESLLWYKRAKIAGILLFSNTRLKAAVFGRMLHLDATRKKYIYIRTKVAISIKFLPCIFNLASCVDSWFPKLLRLRNTKICQNDQKIRLPSNLHRLFCLFLSLKS